ncbi:hypothetical protein CYMTET_5939, partial [Cymbomonas tetramitiformis]
SLHSAAASGTARGDGVPAPQQAQLDESHTALQHEELEVEVNVDESGSILAVSGPMEVRALTSEIVQQVAAGTTHTVFLLSSGEVYSCGEGWLGHEGIFRCPKPKRLEALSSEHIVLVAAGSEHSAAVSIEGRVYTWGRGEQFSHHSGRANALGLGGLHHEFNCSEIPRQIGSLSSTRIVHVAVGGEHTIAVSYSGQAYTFGAGDSGQLGHGDCQSLPSPRLIASIRDLHVTQAAAGQFHSCLLTAAGHVYTFGSNRFGQLGRATFSGDGNAFAVPHAVRELQTVCIKQIAAGWSHNVFLDSAGVVYSFGHGNQGQLGVRVPQQDTPEQGFFQHTPTVLSEFLATLAHTEEGPVVSVAAGPTYTVFVTARGDAYTCGTIVDGVLHDVNSAFRSDLPHRILGLPVVRRFGGKQP